MNRLIHRISTKKLSIKIILLFCFSIYVVKPDILSAQNKPAKIILEAADSLKYDETRLGKGVQALYGNVKFRHTNTILFCDSAYMYRDSNMVIAFSNVHMIQNDSIHLYGRKMDYLGNQDLARVRGNVKMVKGNTTLTTQFLDFDRIKNIGTYFNSGTIINGDNKLVSELGYFYPNLNEAFFKDSVKVYNPDYTMFSDTLKYHTTTEIATLLGPTFIVGKNNLIYSEKGYYNTKKNQSKLSKNSYIQSKEQLLKGDTIFYNRTTGIGEVFMNMDLTDTINHIIIKGDYGFYNELKKTALATKKAQLLQIYQGDTLFLHADTLRADPIPDTDFRLIKAYNSVKFFRQDFQGRCDSMVYNSQDSTNTFFNDPILWAQGSQMTAQTITMYSKNNNLDHIELVNSSFIISKEDSSMFNQIKGKNMTGYIKDKELYKIDVDGNGQTIYYPKDNNDIIGINRAESSDLSLFFKNRKIDKIIMRVKPTGNMNPPHILPAKDIKLAGFIWLEQYQPKSKDDIFIKDQLPKMEERPAYDDFTGEDPGILKPTK